jgi:AmmeMemoRadiSam system protein B
MSKSVDEEEHSLEMQLPFIFAAMSGSTQPYVIVPVMVGQLGKTLGPRIGQVLGPYLDDPSNFFVISSDFCHWGKRFSYQPYDSQAIKKGTPLWTGIEQLDREGMANILTQDPNTFTQYIKRTGNTICGKNPILVLLHAIQYAQHKSTFTTHFTHYAQSSRCQDVHRDSSVSYAAGVLVHHLEVQSGALPTLAQMPPMLDDSKNDDDDSSE